MIEAIQARAEQTYRATERRLAGELEEIETQLQALQQSADAPTEDPVAAAQRQQAAIADYNTRVLDLRQQLREVRAALRAEIDTLNNWLRFANILLVPLLLLVAAGAASLVRRGRLARAVALLRGPQRTA
jgi:small-conductance mechanosensitive channel